MTNAGDAAEEIVKISLEGTEMALRLTGAAAKNIAVALYAIANDQMKGSMRGKNWLKNELKSGTDMSVFMLRKDDTKTFVSAAKRYGLSYCVIKDEKTADDGMLSVFVRSADAARASHIIDRFGISQVKPETTIKSENREKDEFIEALGLTDELKVDAAEKGDETVGSIEKEKEFESVFENPSEARTEKSLSEPSLDIGKKVTTAEEDIHFEQANTKMSEGVKCESVRKKLSDIKERMAANKAAKAANSISAPSVTDAFKSTKSK